ncbi:hypothetical protein [Streptococcus macacae]|uniref:Uncharacterized protein n=1 Tax=Streptococcus macacae NCTC 11558 TaxID=764298 RepID=G5JW13_9STRE|nr:hypothetical protein [Streptococcus macacae]EHJ52262.1 hypothetical protein STRMA_1426 [Streptococcus macacae NCTC 11558]SUN79346.1 Uncharacterised protein [Streptococcus macacae NCTC 11558]
MKEQKAEMLFEEVDTTELNGAARDFILGAAAGATIAGAIIT